MRVAVVGCGLVGTRRAAAALKASDVVVVVADLDVRRAAAVAETTGARVAYDWQAALEADVDAVVVATFNRGLMPIALAALRARKHVLCEKPLGRNAAEARAMLDASLAAGKTLKTGFNHRHHPAVMQAHELLQAGAIGEPTGIRAAYGHGGRPGYEREWRADAELAGGGELLDQG